MPQGPAKRRTCTAVAAVPFARQTCKGHQLPERGHHPMGDELPSCRLFALCRYCTGMQGGQPGRHRSDFSYDAMGCGSLFFFRCSVPVSRKNRGRSRSAHHGRCYDKLCTKNFGKSVDRRWGFRYNNHRRREVLLRWVGKKARKKFLTNRRQRSIIKCVAAKWEHSSAGRASALQAEGHRFEPCCSHHDVARVVQLVRTLACHARGRRFEPVPGRQFASVAQLVEQGTENPRVDGSIPSGGTMYMRM